MDIEELRRKAMASMPHKKKKQQQQQQQQQQQSDSQPGKSPANNLFDTNVVQTPMISCAPSPASVSGNHMERDVALSSLQDLHLSAISPSPEEKDDNLVIRFSDGESDSDAEENHLKMDERHGDMSFQGNIIGSSANHSLAASSQMVTSASQHAPGMWNQMAMMRKQLAAMRTSMSSAIQVRGTVSGASAEGSTWKSSMQKRFIGQKSSIGQKRGVKPGASVTKASGSNLHNLRKQIPTKGGTDLEKLRKQITNKDLINLEDLRKQIATKENELKLQRHMKSGGRPGMLSVPNGKVHPPEIGESTSGSPSRQMCNSSASANLEGTSDKEMGEDNQKVLHVTAHEPPDSKFTKNSLQQQRRITSNASINYNFAKNASIDNNPVTKFSSAGHKRPHAEDNPVARKCLKTTDVNNGNVVVTFQSNSDSAQKHCTSTPSKQVMPDELHLANINCFTEREGIKKRKTDGPSPESGSDIHLANLQSSAQHIPDDQRQISAGGFPNKGSTENVKVISREGEKVKPEIKKTRGQFLKAPVQTTDIQSSSQKMKLGMEQSTVNCWTNTKEEKDGSSVQPFIKEGCSYLTCGRQPVEHACRNKSIFDTSGDIPQGEQMTGGPMLFTSTELVQWQGNGDPQSNIRPVGLHIEDDSLQSGNISLQYLIKEEEAVVKELEEAREHRSRCELEEKLAWEAYRKAQTAVQAINERCVDLHEKRQRLSTQMHAVALSTYSSQESPGRAVGRKEEFYEPQSFSGHKNLSNAVEVTPFLKGYLEASEQPGCKLNECSSIVDNVINSSLQPCIGNNSSSSKYGFQSVKQNSDGRLTGTDVIVNRVNGMHMDNKNLDIGKIYGSVDSGVKVNRNQDIDSCEPELLIETSGQRNEMKEKCPVSRESTFKVSEAFQSHHQLQISENMEPCNISEYGLIREQNLIDSVVDNNVENDENDELLPKSYITPVSLADENQPAVQKCGEPNFQQVICLPQKRKWSNQIVVSECSADGLAKISDPSVSKLNLGMDLVSLKEKTKQEGSVSPGAETDAESLHGQNNAEESNIQLPGKIEEFAHAFPQSQEVPEETVKTTALGHLVGDDVHENSAVACRSENSHASAIENGKTNKKSYTANFSSSIGKKVVFKESSKEKCHSGSSIDEGCAIEKENMAVWKSPIQELATSDNSVPGGSVASDVAYIESQNSMQHIGSAYSGQNRTLEENFAQGKSLALNTIYYEEASNQPLESNLLMSSELKVVFSHVKVILTNNHAIMSGSSGKMTQVMLQDIPEHLPMFLLYESPLNMFKSYNIYSNLIAPEPDKSIACSHVINPFWPLCKFEHRGKCNNEECPWQHARDYSLKSPQFAEHLKKYCNSEMDSSTGKCKTRGKQGSKVCFELQTKEAINRGFNCHFAVSTGNAALPRGFSCRLISNNGVAVPVYRIGPHLIKADGPMVGALIARSTWRFWKLGFCQSFPIPFANQRLLLPDMACLHSVAVREWMLGNDSRLPTCLYSSSVNPDDTKAWKHLFRGLENVECWLELAIDSMNFDSNIDKMDGRKKALCVLSRAIEANPNSVALWVVYLHIFYRKEKVIGKDDMFYHAVQHNKGSYELWLLFINSRLQMDQRLEAYQNAISVLCSKACASEMQDESSSPYVLDLVLQMLNFLSLSGHKQKAMTWIDDLSCSSEGFNKDEQSDFNNAFTVLSCLTKKDACVLWVSCTYYRVYGELPEAILGQLEFEKKLPFDVEWHSCNISEIVIACTLKLMDNAVSNLNACHDQRSQLWKKNDNSLQPVHAVVINHVKCVLAIEGLASARKLCLQYRQLYPFCIELFLISSSIDSHSGDDRAGIAFFDESLSNWPEGIPGIQRFWNQYVGYVLESKGADSAKNIIDKWYFYMDQHKMLDRIIFFRDRDYLTCSPLGHTVGKQEVEEHKDMKEKTHDFFSETGVNRRSCCQDVMFALLNLAIYRFLNNDPKKAQSAADQALKVAFDYGDVKQCIKECAALALLSVPDESEPMKNGFDTTMLQLFDKCFLRSQLFPLPKPLSRAFTESIRKPKIRIFIENLLGPIPVDCSLLNSILEVWHGSSLLPEHFGAFKDLVDFIEGLLELAPANPKLTLSISRMVVQRCNSQSISSVAALFWACSLLINSIFQSFPIASEKVWLEVTKFLELLDVDIILEEFYQQALSIHPFSVALWHSFRDFRQHSNNVAGVVETAKQRGIIID